MLIKHMNRRLELGVYGSFNKFWRYLNYTALGHISKKYADTFYMYRWYDRDTRQTCV